MASKFIQNGRLTLLAPTLHHFKRAAQEIAAHGDNDTLPFDIDTKFFGDKAQEIASIAMGFYQELREGPIKDNHTRVASLPVFSERLIAPSGPTGFRVVTKIQPFWNMYYNGLAISIAEHLEARRDPRTHSYRFLPEGGSRLFDPQRSWRAFKQATVEQAEIAGLGAVVVQTDISSFYEHISHHHIENFATDFDGDGRVVGKQLNALLNKFSAGRSFGLPVGGQGSRVLAELFLKYVDDAMTAAAINWHRYVDDYILIAPNSAAAYRALGTLAQALLNYGLTLNKSKTVFLSTKHYIDYVNAQLGDNDSEATKLRTIDLKFDPYSDNPDEDYESLKETVESLEVRRLLNREIEKSLPDTFLVAQIGRTMRLHDTVAAFEIASTLLNGTNLHAFRSSWSTIMRGIANLRSDERFTIIFTGIDRLLDDVPNHSEHLLEVEASLLHYLRCLRFASTPARTAYVRNVYERAASDTVKRMCIDLWRHWRDRNAFTDLRNKWQRLPPDSQRLLWLASHQFGDQGEGMRRQLRGAAEQAWSLGMESQAEGGNHPRSGEPKYAELFREWAREAAHAT